MNNITNERIRLITVLENLFDSNNRQIGNISASLIESNNNIRNAITNLLSEPAYQTDAYDISNNNINNINNINNGYNSNRILRNTQYADNLRNYYYNQIPQYISSLRNANPQPNLDGLRNSQMNDLIQSFLQPVNVFPTTEQIEHATRVVRYSDIIRPNNTMCPISQEPFLDNDLVSIIRHCNHIFKANQLSVWFQSNCICPVCRFDIRNYTSDTNITNNDANNMDNNANNNFNQTHHLTENQTNNFNFNSNSHMDPIFDVFSTYATNFVNDFMESSTILDVSGNIYTYFIDISGNRIVNRRY
jgi:hypothetical protein